MPTETFSYTGSEQTWTVPDGIQTVEIECYGGSSGTYDVDQPQGGDGGYVRGELSVSPGETLYIYVGEMGGSGDNSGGWPNGGSGAYAEYENDPDTFGTNYGAGGSSDVRQGGSTTDDIAIIAGGGGVDGLVRSEGVEEESDGTGGGGQAPDAQDVDFTAGGDGGAASGFQGGDADVYEGTDVFAISGAGGGGLNAGTAGEADGNEAAGGAGGDGGVPGGTQLEATVGGASTGDGEVVISYTEPAEPPNNVDATYVADDQVDLSFDEDTSGGPVDHFDVEIMRDGASWEDPAGGPSDPTSDGTYSYGPASDTTYGRQVGIDSSFKFRVRAVNDAGSTTWVQSDTVHTTPVPPHNPSVSRPDATTAAINWTTTSDTVTEVNGQYRKDSGSGYGSWNALGGNPKDSGETIGLDSDARYQFRVRSEGPDGKTSAWVYADYGNDGNVFFSDDFESGDTSAWDAVNNDNGSAQVQGGSHSDTGISGPDEGSYYWAGTGEDDTEGTWLQKDLGDLSGESDVFVKCAFAVGSLDNATENFGISWYDGSAWQDDIARIYWEHNEQGWFEVSARVPDSYLSTDNRIRVGTTTDDGMFSGDFFAVDRVVVSDILHEYTTPAAPTDWSLDTSVEDEITATWTNNAAFADYQDMRIGLAENGTSYEAALGPTATSYTFSGLSDGQDYIAGNETYVVQYRNGSQSTSWFADEVTATAVTLLPAPTDLAASNVTADSVDLSWTANHDYGDTLVQYRPTDVGSWTTFATVSRTTETETITGLRNGEEYDARVVANTEHTQTEDS
ncbi:fibronectin type III domain-containing protein [Halomicroarcula sp. F13]|uniref:receptor protein-tyrosine kinase n=1 Tax=Haloarcula rubra TaxID=2487747 RepID=A0AAW4PZW2_9EURY|nr:fibronectin type III domain-containing protein [Halomicroarcula rubra]MBX0325797.1 fibronectin type III domain-containing protein [Halomicroarcula rubra]